TDGQKSVQSDNVRADAGRRRQRKRSARTSGTTPRRSERAFCLAVSSGACSLFFRRKGKRARRTRKIARKTGSVDRLDGGRTGLRSVEKRGKIFETARSYRKPESETNKIR